jgi:cell division protein FtsL
VEHGYADFRARREATIWQRLNRILLVLLIIAIWLVIVSLFVPPYKKLMQSRTEIDNLQQQVNKLYWRGRRARSICLRPM